MKKLLRIAIVPIVTIAAGCATSPGDGGVQTACDDNCPIAVELSADQSQPGKAPDITRVKEGARVIFELRSEDADQPDQQRIVLAFGQAVFVDRRGNPIYALELKESGQTYRVRTSRDQNNSNKPVCPIGPDGCRYVVVNVGNPGRPAVISSPRIIIDER